MKDSIEKSKLREVFSLSVVKDHFISLKNNDPERKILELIFQIDEIGVYFNEIFERVSILEAEDEKKLSFSQKLGSWFRGSWQLSLDELVLNYNQKIAAFLLTLDEVFFKKIGFERKMSLNIEDLNVPTLAQFLRILQNNQVILKNYHIDNFRTSPIYH